jgi:hypothetical protein
VITNRAVDSSAPDWRLAADRTVGLDVALAEQIG